jgi:FKBP-type peptidyl-prolyl cis-trans isomerase
LGPVKNELSERDIEIIILGLRDGLTFTDSGELKVDVSNYLPNINEWIDNKITKKNMELVTNANQKVDDFKKDGEFIETKSGALVKHTFKNESSAIKPLISNSVKVHYEGSLLANDEVFDSSIERGEPITFPLSNVIICWQESLLEVNVGSKVTVLCPPETAYGEDGAPPVIPPNATLKFKIELLEIN